MLPLLYCLISAAERPSEDDMFGAPPATAPVQQAASAAASAMPDEFRDESAILSGQQKSGDAFSEGRAKEDPLKIGGRFYMRASGSYSAEQALTKSSFNVPMIADVYLDTRPTERLRAQILGRLQYDPFFSANVGGASVPSAISNPTVGLDQAWIAFDIARAIFITAGRQHVKWGTSRVFNPTDFLSAQFRDPLAQFDARLGVTMLKASIPWEAKGWNFYVVALFERTQRPVGGLGTAGSSGSTTVLTALSSQSSADGTTFGDIGGAARAEFTFGNTQLGLDGLVQKHRRGRAGFDVTTALGPIDFYGEVAVRAGTDLPLYRLKGGFDTTIDPLLLLAFGYEAYNVPVSVATSGGVSYDIALPNKRSLSLNLEYFFNSAGYKDKSIYPFLLLNGAFQPFYNGQHYGAFTVAFIDNGAKVTTALSNIGNFSDLSFITRVDFAITILSYLSLEAYAQLHYGSRGGEFRFAFALPGGSFNGQTIQATNIVAPLLDLGLGLRLSL